MSNTPIYALGEWAGPQAQPWVQHDAALRVVEALIRSSVADRDLSAPPGSCADGAAFLVAGSPTGAWAGHVGEMAIAVGADASNGWLFAPVAQEGALLWVDDEDALIQYNGAAWNAFSGGGGGGGGDYSVVYNLPISSPVANIDIDISSYNEVHVLLDRITASTSGRRGVQFSTDGGSTFHDTTSDYKYIDSAGVFSENTAFLAHATPSASARGGSFIFRGTNLSGTFKLGETPILAGNTGGTLFVGNTSPVTHLRIFNWNANALVGTLTGGAITVLGK